MKVFSVFCWILSYYETDVFQFHFHNYLNGPGWPAKLFFRNNKPLFFMTVQCNACEWCKFLQPFESNFQFFVALFFLKNFIAAASANYRFTQIIVGLLRKNNKKFFKQLTDKFLEWMFRVDCGSSFNELEAFFFLRFIGKTNKNFYAFMLN